MKFAYVMLCFLLSVIAFAQEDVSLANLSREIEQLRSKIRQTERENPHVYFNEQDNPTRNIQKTMKEVRINREYYCPNHRGFKYKDGVCGWIDSNKNNIWISKNDRGCAAASNNINGYTVWRSYCDQADVTAAKDAEIKRLQDKLQALQEQRRALVMSAADRPRRPDGSGNNSDVIVIRLTKQKVSELYSNKVLYHDGYKIIVSN